MSRLILSLTLAIALSFALATHALAVVPVLSQTTATYRMTLIVGPLATMLTPDQAKTAKSGEAMVAMMGMTVPATSMTDQGQPVNHHLELHVYNKTSGAVVSDQMPTITIADSAGKSRTLSSMALMYDVAIGQSDLHFGNNVYLPDGTYTITAQIGTGKAVFGGVVVATSAPAGTAMPLTAAAAPAMSAASAPVAGLPKTGGVPADLAAFAGLALLGAGVAVRRTLWGKGGV
jgi:LPXTG-motif cell wall-anchored protein